jgi:hypothetical protein
MISFFISVEEQITKYIVCTAHLPLSKDSLREILVACYVIGIPTTSMSWESLSLNLTVTEEKMGGEKGRKEGEELDKRRS